jgi:hypothetical protein
MTLDQGLQLGGGNAVDHAHYQRGSAIRGKARRVLRAATGTPTVLTFSRPTRDSSWVNLVRSGSGLDGFDDPRDMVG